MRLRGKLILPVAGLILFAGETYDSVRVNREGHHQPGRYFWWSSIRLDSDPLDRRPRAAPRCKIDEENCVSGDLTGMWVDPGWLTMLVTLSGLPAFVAGKIIVVGLGHLGINEIWSFMILIPILLFAWYYFIGLLVDRWVSRRRQRV